MGPISDLALPHAKKRLAEEAGRGYNPEDPNIKPPSTPPPPPPPPPQYISLEDVHMVPFPQILSDWMEHYLEDRLREIIREEIKKVQEEDAYGKD